MRPQTSGFVMDPSVESDSSSGNLWLQNIGQSFIRIRTTVRIGKAYQQIIELASETGAELMIMAVSGRGALDLAAFGSTTHRVIQFGPCPVLIVHD